MDCEVVKQQIKDLYSSNHHSHFEQTVSKMKEIVPEFIFYNSAYEVLDLKNHINGIFEKSDSLNSYS